MPLRNFIRHWMPVLPGSSWRGQWIAAVGALLGISLSGLLTAAALGHDWRTPLLMAPLAASAVILYAIPASPLAGPWAIVVGHTISALVGVTVARLIPNPVIASGVAVSAALMAMAATRSLHPPGGSTALIGVIGGPAVTAAGYYYAVVPVGVNAVMLSVLGVLYHRFISGHPYPHVTPISTAPAMTAYADAILPEDIEVAVARYGEVLDVDREDVEVLVREVERAASERRRSKII